MSFRLTNHFDTNEMLCQKHDIRMLAKNEMNKRTFNRDNCLIAVDFDKVKANCDCPYACESVEYSSTLSYSSYPSDIDARVFSIKELKAEGKNATEEAIQNRIVEIRFGDYQTTALSRLQTEGTLDYVASFHFHSHSTLCRITLSGIRPKVIHFLAPHPSLKQFVQRSLAAPSQCTFGLLMRGLSTPRRPS